MLSLRGAIATKQSLEIASPSERSRDDKYYGITCFFTCRYLGCTDSIQYSYVRAIMVGEGVPMGSDDYSSSYTPGKTFLEATMATTSNIPQVHAVGAVEFKYLGDYRVDP